MTTLRRSGTDRSGSDYSAAMIQAVWEKGRVIPGRDHTLYRLDSCNALIYRWGYGDTTPNGTGWEIDHIQPATRGGSDALSNLQPLQWQNNRTKGDDYPQWSCAVSAKSA